MGDGPKAIGKPKGPKLGQKGEFGYFFGNDSTSCVYAKMATGNPNQLQPTKGSVSWSRVDGRESRAVKSGRRVLATFQSPVHLKSTGQECPVNPQAGKPALRKPLSLNARDHDNHENNKNHT